MRNTLFGILLLATLTLAGAASAQVAVTRGEGGFTATCYNYTVKVGDDGSIHSLVSGGTEFLLDGPRGLVGAGYQTLTEGAWKSEPFKFDKVELTAPDTLVATADKHKLTMRFVTDGIELSFSHLAEPTIYTFIVNPGIKDMQERTSGESVPYGSIPRDGIITLFNDQGANVTFPTGNFYYIARNSAPSMKTGADPMVMMDWMPRTWGDQVLTQKVTIHARPTVADALAATVEVPSANQIFPGGAPAKFKVNMKMKFPDLALDSDVQLVVNDFLTKKEAFRLNQPCKLAAGGWGEVSFAVTPLPAFYEATITVKQGADTLVTRNFPFAYDIAKMTPPERPADFDKFWDDTLAEQAKIDPNWQLVLDREAPGYKVYRTTFDGMGGRKWHAWLSVPTKPGKYPAYLTQMPSGINVAYLPRMAPDEVGMVLAIAGQELTIPAGMTGFPPDPYFRLGWDYWRTGIDTRETWYYRYAFAACSRAVDLLVSRPEVDAGKIYVTGGSQGGGLAFITAALNPHVGMAVCSSPGLFGLEWKLRYLGPNYWPPLEPVDENNNLLTDPALLEKRIAVVRYGDAANFAPRIKCPVLLELGLQDHVTCPAGALSAWSRLANAPIRAILADPWGGHNGPRGGQLLGTQWFQALEAGDATQVRQLSTPDLPVLLESHK
ncbi:MAG TPA: acetylxylan esterase [Armatimonadota bacterium]|jgi:cephalosporin-C deacetylase